MKLFWIKLANYRQYRDAQTIDFATDDAKSITIVLGTTGAGKTNLLNAIYWCLYGYEPEFEGLTDGVPPICNSRILAARDGLAKVSIELAFGEETPKYFFKRTLSIWNQEKAAPLPPVEAILIPTNLPERSTDRPTKVWLNANLRATARFEAWISERSGHEPFLQPDYLVDDILPRELAFVFLFNGGRLDEFFTSHANLQKALEDISQITLVKRAVEQLTRIRDDLRKVASKGIADVEKAGKDLEEIDKQLVPIRERKQARELKLESLRKLRKGVDDDLRRTNIDRVRELVGRRQTLQSSQEASTDDLRTLEEDRNMLLLDVAPAIYLGPALKETISAIESFGERGKLPPPVRTVFLTDLLETGVCICGRSISEHEAESEEARRHVEMLLKEESSDEVVSLQATEGRILIKRLQQEAVDAPKKLTDLGKRISEREGTIERMGRELNTIRKDLEAFEGAGTSMEELAQKVRSLETNGAKLDQDIETLLGEIGGDQREITSLERDAETKRKEVNEGIRKKAKSEEAVAKWTLSSKSLELLDGVENAMVKEVREQIERGTDSHFRELIWKTAEIEKRTGEPLAMDPGKVRHVEIGSGNEIRVVTTTGENWVRGLSQGETQTLAYAFISALKEAAKVSRPMVVDTPLGIIDEGPPRELFAELLPDYVKGTQLIFLMTSAEYTATVSRILGPRVGEKYRLDYDQAEDKTTVSKGG